MKPKYTKYIHAKTKQRGAGTSIPIHEGMDDQSIAALVKDIGNTLKSITEPSSELHITYHEYSSISGTFPEYMCYHPFENHFVNHLAKTT